MTQPIDPRPRIVMRHFPERHNMLNQYLPGETKAVQDGWVFERDGIHAWGLTRDACVRAFDRMLARRED